MSTSTECHNGVDDSVSYTDNLRNRNTSSKSVTTSRDLDESNAENRFVRTSLPSKDVLSSTTKQIQAEHRRLFPSIEYASRISHFNPKSEYRDFQGFYVLFWIALAFMVVTTVMRNVRDTGYPIRVEIWRLFTIKVWELALADGLMILTTTVSLVLQQFIQSKQGEKMEFRWKSSGIIIQSLYQSLWFVFWITIPSLLNWTWTAQVFMLLHTFAFLMKMHSYAFYNGHLSEIKRRLEALNELAMLSSEPLLEHTTTKREEKFDFPFLDGSQRTKLEKLQEDLAIELTSPNGSTTYPNNLTWSNYFDYILCPTLCYELEYPRTSGIVWTQLSIKILGVLGCIFLLTMISEEHILPVLTEAAFKLEGVSALSKRVLILAETIPMLLIPFMITVLLVFLVLFEFILGAFAEITCFADRRFYLDWWNSTDWMEFSRKWNIPVHHFFRRHVYSASSPLIGRRMATFGTFLLSSLGHELFIACITKKVRGYSFILQMTQLPMIALQQKKWVKERKLLNNVFFWFSIVWGTSMICSLYVLC